MLLRCYPPLKITIFKYVTTSLLNTKVSGHTPSNVCTTQNIVGEVARENLTKQLIKTYIFGQGTFALPLPKFCFQKTILNATTPEICFCLLYHYSYSAYSIAYVCTIIQISSLVRLLCTRTSIPTMSVVQIVHLRSTKTQVFICKY